MKKYILITFLLIIAQLNVDAQKKNDNTKEPIIIETNVNGKGINLEIDFKEGKEIYYPLMAIWIEDLEGNYVQTLYVAKSIAKGVFNYGQVKDNRWVRESKRHPAALPYWGHKRGIKAEDGFYLPTPENPVADAYTGATPTQSFILKTKADGELPDKFRVLLEINQSWDWNEYWTNNKFPDDEQYKTSSQPAVVYATEIDHKSGKKEYQMEVAGHSHYSGKDGKLYKDISTLTSALQIVDKITIYLK